MITMGLGSPNRMVMFGLVNSPLVRAYMGVTNVNQPLPELFKDAYKQVVGSRQKSHHKPAWKMSRFAVKGWLMDRWLGANDVLFDMIEKEYRGTEARYIRQFIMTVYAEKLTQAFYEIQNGNPNNAKQIERELKTWYEYLINRFDLDGKQALFDVYIDVENWWYSCGVAVIIPP